MPTLSFRRETNSPPIPQIQSSEITRAYTTTLYPFTVFQSRPAEIQPGKKISCANINCSSLKEGRQASKLWRTDDANIAVQSLLLNRLIVLLPAARTHFKTDLKQRRNF